MTSHYGFHMVLWHIPLALSGQIADLPHSRLAFNPKLPVPYALPIMLPGVLGTLSAAPTSQPGGVQYTVELTIGQLTLENLLVGNSSCPTKPAVLQPGQPVTWTA